MPFDDLYNHTTEAASHLGSELPTDIGFQHHDLLTHLHELLNLDLDFNALYDGYLGSMWHELDIQNVGKVKDILYHLSCATRHTDSIQYSDVMGGNEDAKNAYEELRQICKYNPDTCLRLLNHAIGSMRSFKQT
jgi:hypothetical protein